MEQLGSAVGILAVLSLGLSAGALLAEACVLVPMWRSQDPDSFLDWYRDHAGLLLKFFGPLEVFSSVLVAVATGFAWFGELPGFRLLVVSTALTLAVLASFPLYFKKANASFATQSIQATEVGAELSRWAKWHWTRTFLSILSFLFAILALAQ